MVSNMWKLVFLSFSTIFLFSCIKEKAIELNFTEIQLPTDLDLNDVYVENDSIIWVAAGKRFGRGAVFYSSDFGSTWIKVLDYDHEIKSLRIKNNRVYAISIGNTLQWTDDNGQNWSSLTMPGWDYFSAADFFSDQSGLLVGGENFGKGIVNKVVTGTNFSIVDADTLQHELTDIQILNDSTIIAVGYGVILRSNNRGQNWIPDNSRGDFFKAISFSDSLHGFVIGDYGSMYNTTDAGLTWNKIKGSNTFFNNNNRFTDISFINKDYGAVCGRKGLLWISENGAETWKPVTNLPDTDFNKVFITQNYLLLASEAAKLFIVNKP
jgi:photosystem II stability/assembly factor-like uncharacterized protein